MPKVASAGAWIALGLMGVVIALGVMNSAFAVRAVQFGFPGALVITHVTLAIHNHVGAEARLWPVLLTIGAFVLMLLSAHVIFVLADSWANQPPPAPHDGAAQMGIFFSALIALIALMIANVAALFASVAGRLTGRLSNLPWRIAAVTLVGWGLLLLGLVAQTPWLGFAGAVSATLLSLAWSVSIGAAGQAERILAKV
ncbi:MAG: hypothetical protein NT015_18300 [Alphaproteobacteria bacterium]|nr:hypothetical protein [Alphaproteobacteria bacterium]